MKKARPNFKIIVIWFLLNMIFFLIVYLSFNLYLNPGTKYCPLSHKLNREMICKIMDKKDGKILIEHYNSYTGKYRLSIVTGNKTRYIVHPVYLLDDCDKIRNNKELKFHKSSDDSLIFDNKSVLIVDD